MDRHSFFGEIVEPMIRRTAKTVKHTLQVLPTVPTRSRGPRRPHGQGERPKAGRSRSCKLRMAARRGASTVRVSGSVLHGNDSESDVDPFVDVRRGATVLDMVRLQNAIAQEPGSFLTCSVRAISATISNKPARSGKMERIKPAPAHRSSARARSSGESPD